MYSLKVFSPRHNKVNSWVEIRRAMHGAAYVPFRGEGRTGGGNLFRLISVDSVQITAHTKIGM